MSLTCPWCYKRVTLDDLIVTSTCWTSRVQTCGRLFIDRRGSLVASLIEARGGMTILGTAEGKLISGGPVHIGPEARIKGDLEAPSIDMAPGAEIQGGFFKIVNARSFTGNRQSGFINRGSSNGSADHQSKIVPRTVPDPSKLPMGGSTANQPLKVRFPTRLPSDAVPADRPPPSGSKPAIKPVVKLPEWFKRQLRAT